MHPAAAIKAEFHGQLCLFKGFSAAFLRPGLEGSVLVETSLGFHADVIFDSHRDFPYFEGDSISSAKGHLPSSRRAINLLNCGKAFLDTLLPTNPTLFVINLNASRAAYYSLTIVFPRGIHQAVATAWIIEFSPCSHRGGHGLARGQFTLVSRYLLVLFFPLHSASVSVFVLQKGVGKHP